jgi:hypothetical protein
MALTGNAEKARQLGIQLCRGQPIVSCQELIGVHLFSRLAAHTHYYNQVVSLAGVHKRLDLSVEVPPPHGN